MIEACLRGGSEAENALLRLESNCADEETDTK
jgi:hypothetical protein